MKINISLAQAVSILGKRNKMEEKIRLGNTFEDGVCDGEEHEK